MLRSSPATTSPDADLRPGAAQTAPAARSARTSTLVAVWVCTALAALSLLGHDGLGFDPWAWLVWGREVARLDLQTVGGLSWKPLPVAVTTLFSALGDLAPELWLLMVRAGSLMLFVSAFRLAHRHAGPVAGALTVLFLVLTPDPEPRLIRTIAEGHEAPLSAGLLLWAIEAHRAGRRHWAMVLGTGLALLRPESWPLLAAYAAWLGWRSPKARPLVAVSLLSIPLLWFGGDWWGSGDPWHGAEIAQSDDSVAEGLANALETAAEVVVVPAWLGAGAAVAFAWRRREPILLGWAGGALAWGGIIVAMAAMLGYAALSRFYLPAGALVCVLAGIGWVRALAAVHSSPRRALAVSLAALVGSPFVLSRATAMADVIEEIRYRARLDDGIPAAVQAAGGPDAVLACGHVAVEAPTLLGPALGWELDIPLASVGARVDGPTTAFVVTGGRLDRRYEGPSGASARLLGTTDEWTVYAIACPVPAPSGS